MRSRSNSGVRLDYYHRLVTKTIISHQHPVTGLLPASTVLKDAWVRDNVYSVISVWGLALAYRKQADLDEDRAKAYELEQHVVKLMRGLLVSMMKQVEKVEAFKKTQSRKDCLHAKYDIQTGDTCVGDHEWGHLQIDATSLYLLMLAQMTASGLQIIFSLDEVAFIQNLVFYIEHAYRIPDYGIWERGDKTNHGFPELNASSIGMAKAAMEALNELDLFGARGGPASVIHVQSDMIAKCQAVLYSMLPRESNSKEIDAGLLGIIGFPAFAVDDEALANTTRQQIIDKLQGRYGCCRFLRDGYKTALEDPNRLYYDPAELKVFENIECEWPLFWAYLLIEGVFKGNKEQADEYAEGLRETLVLLSDSTKVVPELYYVPKDKVALEYKNPHSQDRLPGGKIPHIWGQSFYILGLLLQEGFVAPGEVDPLNRRMSMEPKPDLVIQVSLVAEDKLIKELMKKHNFDIQTIEEVSPVRIYPARVLTRLCKRLGENKKLGLSGKVSKENGLLTTSKLYNVRGEILAFVPQFMDQQQFYLALDNDLLSDICKTDVAYLRHNWREIGRPTITFIITQTMMGEHGMLGSAMWAVIRKIKTGYLNGVQVKMGQLHEFLSTSCIKHLSFLETMDQEQDMPIDQYLESQLQQTCPVPFLPPVVEAKEGQTPLTSQSSEEHVAGISKTRKMSVTGIVQRTRSIDLGAGQMGSRSSSRGLFRQEEVQELPSIIEQDQENVPSPSSEQESLTWFEAVKSPSKLSRKPSFHLLPEDFADFPMKRTASWSEDKMVVDMYKGLNSKDLLAQLSESMSLSDQADILHFLYVEEGLDWDTKLSQRVDQKVTVKTLMEELYYKSAHYKAWSVVRHTAGILEKKVENLAQAVTELLVRQKQVSVGIPPEPREKIIVAPLPPKKLHRVISEACGEDKSSAVLTQELLVYLSMFIRTEPKLFYEMLRIRVGLIMQVMTSELARTMGCQGDKAYEHLMSLSPYEMKDLLHHILSGKEFGVAAASSKSVGIGERQLSIVSAQKDEIMGLSQIKRQLTSKSMSLRDVELEEDVFQEKVGQWLRRRRLDGALNRAPPEFYYKVWKILEKCHGLSIEGYSLPHHMTREMTENEFKFALQVETALNRIPQPEFRQLVVEALMVLSLVVENDWLSNLGAIIQVEGLVIEANEIFLRDQRRKRLRTKSMDASAQTNLKPTFPSSEGLQRAEAKGTSLGPDAQSSAAPSSRLRRSRSSSVGFEMQEMEVKGDATLCCAVDQPRPTPLACGGVAGICCHFYDSAPSGIYGTMAYLAKAGAKKLSFHHQFDENAEVDCRVS
ncbi:probable phosphorylase b kinase regulatory subunit alpha isoform X2 [Acanthaster planci]|uniref:Phosphorylase b kinase regulatory subunit n=1 Tax=Acanthaster planci TaxID=133434 RepID=A0A8B7YEA0_ACAPL|nr:probable phosphorylase b kinase regulatory subunit alpha isoform X2 [Acanthaster planci]